MAADVLGQAWNISQKGEEIITENNTINNKSAILKNALNADFKEIGSPVLSKIQNKTSISQVVLQIQKLRNVSAPKANENSHAAPRMLKLVLTDGDSYIQAIETAPISSLSLEKTPPGSKLLIVSAKISSGYLLLDSNNCSLLGGHVPALYEKWELAKSVQHHSRQNTSSDGPPAWVNFGSKIQSDIQDKSFKSLDNKNQESKENTKFDLQRQDAIAEATSGAVKKVFGGGNKPAAAPVIKPKKPNDFPQRERKSRAKPINVKEVEDKPQKPSERVSLFDFLEDKLDKLPPNEPVNVAKVEPRPVANVNHYNPRNSYQDNRNRNNYNSKPKNQNNSFRGHNEFRSQAPAEIRNQVPHEVRSQPQQNKVEDKMVNGLSNSFDKMSLNTQFASRSLKQHLNLGPQKKNNVDGPNNVAWKVGDDCVAKYWEDGKFYNATITAITDRTCVVKFKGYGNIEEVLKVDCLPVATSESNKKSHYTGPMEFRRSYKRQ